MKNTNEILADIAQTTFLVFGGLCLLFSGYLITVNLLLSFILLLIGALSVMIRVEYTKYEVREDFHPEPTRLTDVDTRSG